MLNLFGGYGSKIHEAAKEDNAEEISKLLQRSSNKRGDVNFQEKVGLMVCTELIVN
jgi:hypothetical protein